jgi:ribonuclease HIII
MGKSSTVAGVANLYTVEITQAQAAQLRDLLTERGFEFSKPAYTLFSAKGPSVTCAAYTSGKLVIQGKGAQELMEFLIEPEVLGSFGGLAADIDLTPRIGQDESGKGDFFGPLCVAGVCAAGDQVQRLITLGVRDSKTLGDKRISALAASIRAEFPHYIIALSPPKYNELYPKFGNLNRFLAWAHATTAENLIKQTPVRLVIIDQFAAPQLVERALASKKVVCDVRQRVRAESDPVVAAASILARDAFVRGLAQLGSNFDVELPKGGASPGVISAGRLLLMRHGPEVFTQVAKIHFSTLKQIVGES